MEILMKKAVFAACAASALLIGSAQAQGLIGGAQQGIDQGNAAAGPLGGIVGGAVGAATGTVGGVIGGDPLGMGRSAFGGGDMFGMNPSFRDYVAAENLPSYNYRGDVRVGTVLPRRGVTYYVVPQSYGQTIYNYTVVNNEAVLVDPRTHRIVQMIN
jgi:hypothetical protein